MDLKKGLLLLALVLLVVTLGPILLSYVFSLLGALLSLVVALVPVALIGLGIYYFGGDELKAKITDGLKKAKMFVLSKIIK